MSGTALIDLSSTGDLQNFLSVGGSHDAAFDSFGVINQAGFTAYPWDTTLAKTNTAYNSLDKLRRAPSGKIVEEWLRVYEQCHDRSDLATAHDALDSWLLPDGSAASTLTIGGTQFNGFPFCKTSWWEHVNRQRYCLERAMQGANLWTGGATPDSLAETYVQDRADTNSGGYAFGKMCWGGGWRSLLFPWAPATTYGGTTVYQVRYRWTPDTGQADWDETGSNFTTTTAGTAGGTADCGYTSTNVAGTNLKTVRYIVFAGPRLLCSSGSTITRPRSSLHNVFGFPDTTIARLKRGASTTAGSGACTYKLGFFWYDGSDPPAGGGAWPTRLFESESTILGDVTTTEANFDLSSIVDLLWNATAGVSSGLRVPCFWMGPEWGSAVPDAALGEDHSDRCFSSTSTDSAATAGVTHLVPWHNSTTSDFRGPKIGTDLYPFR